MSGISKVVHSGMIKKEGQILELQITQCKYPNNVRVQHSQTYNTIISNVHKIGGAYL